MKPTSTAQNIPAAHLLTTPSTVTTATPPTESTVTVPTVATVIAGQKRGSVEAKASCTKRPKKVSATDGKLSLKERNRASAKRSRERAKQRQLQATSDNERLKKELSELKAKRPSLGFASLGFATIEFSEESEERCQSSGPESSSVELRPIFPKPPQLITESEQEREERLSRKQQELPSPYEIGAMYKRVASRQYWEKKKIKLEQIETENRQLADEIESLKKILSQ